VTVRPRTGPDGSVVVDADDPDAETPQTAAAVHPTVEVGAVPEATALSQPVSPAAGTGAVDIVSSPVPPPSAPPGDGGPVPHDVAKAADSQVPHPAASVVNAAATRSAIALARLTGGPRSADRNGDVVQTQPIPSAVPPMDPADGTTGSSKPGSSDWRRGRARLGRWRTDARYTVANWARWAVERWRRSLQLRVAVTTMLLSGLVVVIAGILSVGAISAGVLDSKRNAAHAEVINGVRVIQDQLAAAAPQDRNGLDRATQALLRTVGNRGTAAGLFSIVVVVQGAPPFVSGSTGVADVPQQLRQQVEAGKFADMYSPVRAGDGTFTKGLIVGAPVPRQQSAVQLYYLFPLEAEQRTLTLVRNTVLLTGILLVALLAVVALMVTRQVVRPVRVAAEVAERFASGRLRERMTVRGEDDLAALAASFNDMADSLQGQITKLEEMSRLQRRFTSDVSHELRTPLTTIRMATDVLHASRPDFEPHVARSAELLHAELDRFESLLADLLEISRYDAHVAVLEPDPIDLRALVRTSVDTVAAVAERAHVPIEVDMPDGPVVADVDSRRVERILRNLLLNAVEHSEGRPVEVALRGDGRAVAVTVRDHGVGLRPGEAALVFDRFWRADPSRNRRTGGTGLGLSISLEDARLHGGWLHAWGRPGHGAQFRLTLPAHSGDTVVSSPLPIEPPDVTRPTGAGPRSTQGWPV
jgi:two-component system, OmpR family, sensor histidine kinase MtrB